MLAPNTFRRAVQRRIHKTEIQTLEPAGEKLRNYGRVMASGSRIAFNNVVPHHDYSPTKREANGGGRIVLALPTAARNSASGDTLLGNTNARMR